MSEKLNDIMAALRKKGIMSSFLADDASPCVVNDFLSSGCLVLDEAMGGGLPMGRIVEIYGDTSTGKSLIAAQACATVQEQGGIAVYIDTETAVSLPIMGAVGVDIDTLIYLAPDTVEDVFSAMETVIAEKGDREMLIVWDSIAATSAQAEMDKNTGETGYLTHARIISQGLRKLTRIVSKSKVSLLFLNQSKENIGVVFGDSVATFGGKAVGYHSSIRVQLSIKTKLKDGKRIVGVMSHAKVTKNKIAPPFREVGLPIYFGYGIDDAEATLEFLVSSKRIDRKGGRTYTFASEGDEIGEKIPAGDWPTWYEEHREDVQKMVRGEFRAEDLV